MVEVIKKLIPDIPRKTWIKGITAIVIAVGFCVCSYGGGVLGMWAMFCGTVAGFVGGLFLANKGE